MVIMHPLHFLTGFTLTLCSFFSLAAAVPYQVIQDTNTSIGTKRIRASITIFAPTAHDKISRADTIKQAIEDKVTGSHAVVVTALLIPSQELLGSGALLAKGEYYADGCGASGTKCDGRKLIITSTDIHLSDSAIKIWGQSVISANELAEKGIFDEEAVTADVAKKLKIRTSEVNVPYIELEPVITL